MLASVVCGASRVSNCSLTPLWLAGCCCTPSRAREYLSACGANSLTSNIQSEHPLERFKCIATSISSLLLLLYYCFNFICISSGERVHLISILLHSCLHFITWLIWKKKPHNYSISITDGDALLQWRILESLEVTCILTTSTRNDFRKSCFFVDMFKSHQYSKWICLKFNFFDFLLYKFQTFVTINAVQNCKELFWISFITDGSEIYKTLIKQHFRVLLYLWDAYLEIGFFQMGRLICS